MNTNDNNEVYDWDNFDWDKEIWNKQGHTRQEIEQAVSKTFTDEDWSVIKSEVEYVCEDYIFDNVNQAILYVIQNLDKIKADHLAFQNLTPDDILAMGKE